MDFLLRYDLVQPRPRARINYVSQIENAILRGFRLRRPIDEQDDARRIEVLTKGGDILRSHIANSLNKVSQRHAAALRRDLDPSGLQGLLTAYIELVMLLIRLDRVSYVLPVVERIGDIQGLITDRLLFASLQRSAAFLDLLYLHPERADKLLVSASQADHRVTAAHDLLVAVHYAQTGEQVLSEEYLLKGLTRSYNEGWRDIASACLFMNRFQPGERVPGAMSVEEFRRQVKELRRKRSDRRLP